MASQYVIDLGYNDDLTTVIKKVNHNFKAVMGQQTKQAQIESEDAANAVAQIVGDAVDDLVDQIEHEADLREAADDDLDDAITGLNNSLATVAFSGDYDDLINQPVIPPGVAVDSAMSSTSENPVQNKVIYSALQDKADSSNLATVATSGDYDDLIDKPAIPKMFYGTCSTAAGTQNKEITCPGFTSSDLVEGTLLIVLFSNANTYNGTCFLNVNNTGNITTGYNLRYYWKAAEVVQFVYLGSAWQMIEQGVANTTYYGPTKLSSSTSSTSTSLAATASAVKAAYDLAASAVLSTQVDTDVSNFSAATGFTRIGFRGHKYGNVVTVTVQVSTQNQLDPGNDYNIGNIVADWRPLEYTGGSGLLCTADLSSAGVIRIRPTATIPANTGIRVHFSFIVQ